MESAEIVDINAYGTKKRESEDLRFDPYDNRHICRKLDKLGTILSSEEYVLRAKKKPHRDTLRVSSLFLSTFIMASTLTLSVFSSLGHIDLAWQFFASISLASGGLAAASFLILVGVDSDSY